MSEPEILFEQRGRLGLITLNRPKAMNALTYGMIKALDRQLNAWALDDAIKVVAIQGAGDKAFAAGGDIRWLYDNGQGGKTGEKNFEFFADEYRLNTRIKRFPKPYVGVMDGIVMGGGVGVSIHGSHRFVTERTMFAMPETGIGLFPDVGATYFLPRMPGSFGMYCGLTGARLTNDDAVQLLDAQPLTAKDVPKLLDWLSGNGDLGMLDTFTTSFLDAIGLGPTNDWQNADLSHLPSAHSINEAFSLPGVDQILDCLKTQSTDWGAKKCRAILSKSPTSTRIAFRQIQEGATLDFEDCMRLEYRLARYCMTHPDFYEGVRAVILDKDNAPQWSPATLTEATDDFVAEAFRSLGPDELQL